MVMLAVVLFRFRVIAIGYVTIAFPTSTMMTLVDVTTQTLTVRHGILDLRQRTVGLTDGFNVIGTTMIMAGYSRPIEHRLGAI